MQQLSGVDSIFVYGETSRAPLHIGMLGIYDPSTAPGGKVSHKNILKHFENRLDGAMIFRRKVIRVPLDLGKPYWVEDEDFDLEYHVRHVGLPKPGDWRQLCILASRIYSRPLDFARPLWETTIIEGLDNVKGYASGSFALLTKTHHSAVDGMSLMKMMDVLHDEEPGLHKKTFERTWKPEKTPTNVDLLSRSYFNALTSPIQTFSAIREVLPIPDRLKATRQEHGIDDDQEKPPVPRTRFSGRVTAHRVIEGRSFALSDIKKIRVAFPGATVNDVMLAIVGGTLRKYLGDKKELPKDPMTVIAPISVRADDDLESEGNKVSAMMVSVGEQLADPGERIAHIREDTGKAKLIADAMGKKVGLEVSSAVPAALISTAMRTMINWDRGDDASVPANTIVTNVPGPMSARYFAGAEVQANYGIGAIMDGLASFHAIFSYNGKVHLTVISDREILPDPETYAEAMQYGFDELKKAAERQPAEKPVAKKFKKSAKSKSKKSTKKAPSENRAAKSRKKTGAA